MPAYEILFSKLYVYRKMNLQEVSNLLSIDFTAMELQSGFNKLSKNQITTSHQIILSLNCQIING